MLALIGRTFQKWTGAQAPVLAAALAYYAIFSIAPLLLIVIGVLGLVLGENAAQSALMEQIRGAVGPQASGAIESMLQNMGEQGGGLVATAIGVGTVVVGATGVFAQLQNALNVIWEVKPDPEASGILHLLVVRLQSLVLILAIGLVLLASLMLSAALSALGPAVTDALPSGAWFWQLLNAAISFAVILLLFAMIFKVLPDARIRWRDVWVGAGVTALLFVAGNQAFGLYLGINSVASTYGAAGSLVVLLLWVYFSAQVLLIGASFTQVYARWTGSSIEPDEHAVRSTEGIGR